MFGLGVWLMEIGVVWGGGDFLVFEVDGGSLIVSNIGDGIMWCVVNCFVESEWCFRFGGNVDVVGIELRGISIFVFVFEGCCSIISVMIIVFGVLFFFCWCYIVS